MRTNAGILAPAIMLAASVLPLPSASSDTQVPLDSAGKIPVIDAPLEDRLKMFTDHPGFKEARLFKLAEDGFSLEIISESGGSTLRDRVPLSATETEAFRAKVTGLVNEKAPQAVLDQKGRTRLVNGIRLLSVGFYGWALPAAFNVSNGGTAGGLYLVSAGTGFFMPLLITKNMRVTEGQAELAMYGGLYGISHAVLLHLAIQGWEDMHARTVLGTSMCLSLAELCVFYNVADAYGVSGGAGRTISVGSGFGTGIGLGAAYLAGADEDTSRIFGVAGLAGSAAGFWAGQLLSKRQNYSLGDASILGATGGLGAYLPCAFMLAGAVDEPKAYTAGAMAGSVLGLAAGHLLTADRDLTEGQAFLLGLGVASGNLLGLGITYLSRPNDFNSRMFFASSAIGSVAGFALAWWWAADDTQAAAPPGNVQFRLSPDGLLAALPHRDNPVRPFASLEASF